MLGCAYCSWGVGTRNLLRARRTLLTLAGLTLCSLDRPDRPGLIRGLEGQPRGQRRSYWG